MQKWVVVSWALLALVAAEECPDGGRCGEGQTCCNDPADGYECCPFDQAECCSDHTHCCPADTICDAAKSSCVNATLSIPWAERASAAQPRLSKSFRMIKAYMGEDDDNICPDQSRCPPEFSCLKALTKFGCCPLAQGVPCSDGKHCCPESHQCSADSRSCIRQELVTTVVCSDGVSECPDQTTCCENPDGNWGCCPIPKAVCCEDKLHCCPEESTCDVEHSKCISLSTKKEMPMWAKLPARIRAEWENKKEAEPVTAETVNDGVTEKAPEVTTANTIPPTEQEVTVSSVTKGAGGNVIPCNDTVGCADETTCCKTKDGGWACCPLPEAVCCDDLVHCCPKGKKCNMAAQTCEDDTCSVPWVKKMPTIPKQGAQSKDVICDSTTSCEDGTTCCKTKEGGWACCPFPEAVCCEDFLHCCPKGKTCNLAAQTCDGHASSMPWVEKVPAIPKQGVQSKDVICDSTTSCEDGTTCCKTKEGGWACCPLPEAVCCEDFIHCCPKGKTCNLAAQTCDGDTSSMPWVEKVPAIPKQGVQVGDVACDSTASCPDGTTCCKNKEGLWACCPLPEAVCCDDHETCCPHGTTCDLTTGSCLGPSGSTPLKQKTPAFTTPALTTVAPTTESQVSTTMQTEEEEEEEPKEEPEEEPKEEPEEVKATQTPKTEEENMGTIQCDAHTSCPQYTTCCFMASSQKWGCCPLPEAVCCADGNHCCPTHYKCNEHQTSCVKGEVVIPWYTKLPATTNVQADPSAVKCEGLTQCPEHTTCCRLFTGEWGCCPLQNAVCCPDMEHCCPEGYTCNIASNSCQKVIMLQLETIPLTQVYLPEHRPQPRPLKHSDVKCDEQTSCKDGETCCKTSATTWGCCPSPNAVCCSDMMHCCPTGYTCTEAGACIQNTKLHWYNWHEFFANKKRALIV
ncbi:granulins-like [Seriola lalandi dorsalis]|uniref:granulins-like n=1 Tax=Seriola lalandi dorsalis TaxID=1841481 RepID=UPI000C6FB59B|nr:granulins-like [Seriola lalandi dorsalis]